MLDSPPNFRIIRLSSTEPRDAQPHQHPVHWYLYDLQSETIVEEPTQVAAIIRCQPDAPRHCAMPKNTLADIRAKVERHIKNTYLKSVQAPLAVKPVLKAWMELS